MQPFSLAGVALKLARVTAIDPWRFMLMLICIGSSAALASIQEIEQKYSSSLAATTSGDSPGLRITADFPGGNIRVGQIENDVVRLRQERRDTEGWWFYWYFRAQGAEGRKVRFEFTDGEPVGVRGPAVSLDGGKSWDWLGAKSSTAHSFNYEFGPGQGDARFAFTIPYLQSDWENFLRANQGNPKLHTAVLCRSRKNRAVECLYLGRTDQQPRHRILLTARHHACESMANFALEGLLDSVIRPDTEEGRWLAEQAEILAVPFVDKDGVEDGDQGKNRRPHDHNRDYSGESIHPETGALRRLAPQWSQDKWHVALDLHCPWIRGPRNESIYIVGSSLDRVWKQQQRLGELLEKSVQGPLPYHSSDNLPYGVDWNKDNNYGEGKSCTHWAEECAGVQLAASFELPYANASSAEVNPASARAFGRDLARATARYLQEMDQDRSSAFAPAPNLILHNGKIVTVDEKFSIHQAMAVQGNRIVAVGRNVDVLGLKGAGTEIADLKERMVLPGLIDSHSHPTAAAMMEYDHPIPQMETIADVLAYFRERAKVVKEGDWIVLQQVFITRLREQRYPTRAELDSVGPKHPVAFRTGPDAAFNTLALKRAGIDRNFKIPPGLPGQIEKDERGEPTGILRSFANYVAIPSSARKASEDEKRQRVKELFRDYNSAGLTSIADRDLHPSELELYKDLRQNKQLSVRLSCSYHIDTVGSMEIIKENIRQVARNPLFTEKDDMLRIVGVKTYLDGGMLTGSAYLREPWGVSQMYGIRDPNYRGTLFIPRDRLAPMVQTAVESGLQFTAHTVGDGAVHALLDAYEEVNKELPIRNTRPCISHANFESQEAVGRMRELGVSVDIQPAWLFLDTRTLVKHFGYDRLRWFQPLRSLFEAGVVAGGGSDHMQKIGSLRSINPYNPFLGIQTTITRQAKWYDGILHPEETLTREQAIRFYTINNAWLLFQESKLGSLEAGKLADFIVVDTDLLGCPVEKLVDTKVLRTYVDGKLVYRRE